MRKVTCVVGLAVVLGVAYWFDLHVLPGLQNAIGEFNPAPSLWVEAAAHLAIALLLVGLGWLVFLWSEPSRVVGLIYAVAGAALLLAWPESVSFHIEIPGFAALNLWLALGEDGLLNLIAPFVTAMGIARFVLPLPVRLRAVPLAEPQDATVESAR